MNFDRPLYWHQGLFLQPQHFQLSDLRYEFILNLFRQFAGPYSWGVKILDWEEAALRNGTVSISSGEMIFPDGTWASIPSNTLVPSRTLEEGWMQEGKPVVIHAAIKKLNEETSNVTVLEKLDDLSKVTTRYVTQNRPEEINDIHGDGPPGQVRRLYQILRLFFSHEEDQLGDYIFMPIAQVVREGDDIVLSPKFIAPSISVTSDTVLNKMIKEIRDLLAGKAHQLEEFKRDKGLQAGQFGSRDMTYLLALRSINRYIPLLFQITETGNVHPWHVYAILRQLIGELSVFSEDYNVMGKRVGQDTGLPAYDHRDLFGCFSVALHTLVSIVEQLTAGPEYVISLEFDGTYYTSELRPSIFHPRNKYYLAVKSNENPEKIRKSMIKDAKLSSREFLPILIARALPGIKLEYLSVPPQELPRKANTYYFQIDSYSDQWSGVEQGLNIALYWDTAPEDVEVHLIVVETL